MGVGGFPDGRNAAQLKVSSKPAFSQEEGKAEQRVVAGGFPGQLLSPKFRNCFICPSFEYGHLRGQE